MYYNWHLLLKKPEVNKVIFEYEYRKGEDFEIWEYDDINQIISSNGFKKSTEKDDEFVRNILYRYYSQLDDTEKELFDKNTSTEELARATHYYLYKERGSDEYILLIACPNNKKVYYLHVND